MLPLKAVPDTKLEKTITIGNRSHRIANDHHALLADLNEQFRYFSMQELLFFTSLVGARLLQSLPICTMLDVQKSRGGG